ncbi:MAG TPA: NAD(P)-dependent alcohol dehydrogenase [Candidatus Limnocylindrales bacterium]|nr:NAD(P)-dependent alcohol dehydrogenase [Candidatus Limnocylindrales bacterium]
MKAIIQQSYGPPDLLRLDEVEKPVPGPDQVLVRVEAASVNARDWHFMRGDPVLARLSSPALGMGAPKVKIRGSDFAGRVEAVGGAVTRFRPGDEVYGDLREGDGAFAEYLCAPQSQVEPKPSRLSFEQAAAAPLAGCTALAGLRDAAQLQAGQRVLINGASGGVGTFAVQIAKSFGANVTAVCSTRNVELVRSLGADRVVDYTREDFSGTGRHDAVFDLVGNRSLADLRRALTPGGIVVLSGGGVSGNGKAKFAGPMGLMIKGMVVGRFSRDRIRLLTDTSPGKYLAPLSKLLEAGEVTPVIDRGFPLEEVPQAIRYVETEHARAKVVITVP